VPSEPSRGDARVRPRRIYLVRHGETLYRGSQSESALPGDDLTEEGYRQIEALAELLAAIEIDAIYASPLGRAQATALTIARRRAATVTTVGELCEIVPGNVMGMEIAQIFAAVHAFFVSPETRWDTPYLGGETYRALRDRAWTFFESLQRRTDWQRVVVVAHGGLNNAVIGRVLGSEGPGLVNVEQDFGCVNIIDIVDDRPVLRLLNFTAYDPLKTGMEAPSMDILKALLEAGFGVTASDPEGEAR
jgi:broad specificity phosphatase PhoE